MRPITDVLREIRRGRAVDIASRMLADVVRAVDETGKKGSVTITLTVEPEEGGGSQKTITAEVKHKLPVESIPTAVFFSDEEGTLHRVDPQQAELFQDTGMIAAQK